MSEARKRIEQRILNGDINRNVEAPKPKKRNFLVRLALYPYEVLKIIFGIDKDSLERSQRVNELRKNRPFETGNSFKEQYKVPQPYIDHHPQPSRGPHQVDLVQYANLMEYLDSAGIDNCDCDHDDR